MHIGYMFQITKHILLSDKDENIQNAMFKLWFHDFQSKKAIQTYPMQNSNSPINLSVLHLAAELQSSVCGNWQWVFHIAVEEFWPLFCWIVLIQPRWMVF